MGHSDERDLRALRLARGPRRTERAAAPAVGRSTDAAACRSWRPCAGAGARPDERPRRAPGRRWPSRDHGRPLRLREEAPAPAVRARARLRWVSLARRRADHTTLFPRGAARARAARLRGARAEGPGGRADRRARALARRADLAHRRRPRAPRRAQHGRPRRALRRRAPGARTPRGVARDDRDAPSRHPPRGPRPFGARQARPLDDARAGLPQRSVAVARARRLPRCARRAHRQRDRPPVARDWHHAAVAAVVRASVAPRRPQRWRRARVEPAVRSRARRDRHRSLGKCGLVARVRRGRVLHCAGAHAGESLTTSGPPRCRARRLGVEETDPRNRARSQPYNRAARETPAECGNEATRW